MEQTKPLKVINFFAGPGAGKSTTAADLFSLMKWNNINVELIDEYAKQATWEKRFNVLEDQLYLLAKQNRKLQRLKGQVDFVINDSPILLGIAYMNMSNCPPSLPLLTQEVFSMYDNTNIFVNRCKPYHQTGRNQDENGAKEIDNIVKNLLNSTGNTYTIVDGTYDSKFTIYDILKEKYNDEIPTNTVPRHKTED